MIDLNKVYEIVSLINDGITKGSIDKTILKDMKISFVVAPSILFGIDKEFYKMSHDNSLDGFIHTDKVCATIDNVNVEFIKDDKIKN